MIVGVIVEVVIPTGSASGPPSKQPSSQEGVKERVKKQLHSLGKLLANQAGKAAAALPGVIGSVISWLLSATWNVINWFGNNLWAVVVAVAWLLYVAAKEWIVKEFCRVSAATPIIILPNINAVLLISWCSLMFDALDCCLLVSSFVGCTFDCPSDCKYFFMRIYPSCQTSRFGTTTIDPALWQIMSFCIVYYFLTVV